MTSPCPLGLSHLHSLHLLSHHSPRTDVSVGEADLLMGVSPAPTGPGWQHLAVQGGQGFQGQGL